LPALTNKRFPKEKMEEEIVGKRLGRQVLAAGEREAAVKGIFCHLLDQE
jgi:hypothetical protein